MFVKFILKVAVVPVALALAVVSALCRFLLAVSGVFFSLAAGLVFLGAVVLFVMGEPLGGAAFLGVAFLVSPFGLYALAGRVVGLLGDASSALRGFIFG